MDTVQRSERSRELFNRPGAFRNIADNIQAHWDSLACGDRSAQKKLTRILHSQHSERLIDSKNFTAHYDSDTPYHWQTLIENEQLHAGLLYLPNGGWMPAHDHPDTIGYTQVISGRPYIILSSLGSPAPPSRKRLNPGDLSLTFPRHYNIHGFENTGIPALLLSVNIFDAHNFTTTRKWHFSLHAIDSLFERTPGVACGVIALSILSLASDPASATCTLTTAKAEIEQNNFSNAASLLEDCAETGVAIAQCKLGDLYYTGKGVEQDYYTAAQWYRKAAEQGDTQAQYLYGLMLIEGLGITDDAEEGLDWIFKAMQAGHTEAKQTFEYLLANPAPLDC